MAGVAGLISALSGAPQQAPAGTPFPKPLVALVTDANGNPVSGVTVTFVQQGGQSAFCTFAGGVNTAATYGSGLATSAAMTAGPTAGQYPAQAWIGTPGPRAIGPANFWILNSAPGPYTPGDLAAIQSAWTTAKPHLARAQATLATLQANLATVEADCDALYAGVNGGPIQTQEQQPDYNKLSHDELLIFEALHRKALAVRIGTKDFATLEALNTRGRIPEGRRGWSLRL